ncbi:hypothetical protein GCM10007940_12970 [Portibacter lacus]|uniref:Type VI secretion protein n=1 Tax=Portibacter lacus TaxID=1099794 RepID=A0AA37SMR0_9BACT|nr:PAAR domain-containing protein [Portibacter lacus]GLR16682.1 hypothetical protein GCM10007940_12970 [Portibacter lacus]
MFAARLTDMHVCPMVTPGVPPIPHVGGPIIMPIMGKPCLIGGLPAAGSGSMCTCVGPPDSISPACATNKVMVNGTPLAKVGDMTIHGGSIVMGCFTVMIGAGAMNPSAIAGMISDAQAAASEVISEAAAVMDEIAEANDEINALLEQDNLSESEQNRLNELQDGYNQAIDDTGMNNDDFTDWTD